MEPMNDLSAATPAVAAHSKEREYCKILAILHFVYGALALVTIGFPFLHYTMMSSFSEMSGSLEMQEGSDLSAEEFQKSFQSALDALIWLYISVGVASLIAGILNIMSGLGLLKFRWKAVIYATSAFNCLNIPLGLVLAIFTFLNLAKPEVSKLFERSKS